MPWCTLAVDHRLPGDRDARAARVVRVGDRRGVRGRRQSLLAARRCPTIAAPFERRHGGSGSLGARSGESAGDRERPATAIERPGHECRAHIATAKGVRMTRPPHTAAGPALGRAPAAARAAPRGGGATARGAGRQELCAECRDSASDPGGDGDGVPGAADRDEQGARGERDRDGVVAGLWRRSSAGRGVTVAPARVWLRGWGPTPMRAPPRIAVQLRRRALSSVQLTRGRPRGRAIGPPRRGRAPTCRAVTRTRFGGDPAKVVRVAVIATWSPASTGVGSVVVSWALPLASVNVVVEPRYVAPSPAPGPSQA